MQVSIVERRRRAYEQNATESSNAPPPETAPTALAVGEISGFAIH